MTFGPTSSDAYFARSSLISVLILLYAVHTAQTHIRTLKCCITTLAMILQGINSLKTRNSDGETPYFDKYLEVNELSLKYFNVSVFDVTCVPAKGREINRSFYFDAFEFDAALLECDAL